VGLSGVVAFLCVKTVSLLIEISCFIITVPSIRWGRSEAISAWAEDCTYVKETLQTLVYVTPKEKKCGKFDTHTHICTHTAHA